MSLNARQPGATSKIRSASRGRVRTRFLPNGSILFVEVVIVIIEVFFVRVQVLVIFFVIVIRVRIDHLGHLGKRKIVVFLIFILALGWNPTAGVACHELVLLG